MKRAMITGVYGQDGSYLAEELFRKGYEVYGIIKRRLSNNSKQIKSIIGSKGVVVNEIFANIYSYDEIGKTICLIKPDEVYHMASVHRSSQDVINESGIREQELYNLNVLSTENILESVYKYSPGSRVVAAGSCLMFDNSKTRIQSERTKYESNSLYGLAKIAENSLVRFYRSKGVYACTAILYNHESSRRSEAFVTQKIVKNLFRVKQGMIKGFDIGSIDIMKDWSHAIDIAHAMHLMLQQDEPEDLILSSGEGHTVEEFMGIASEFIGINNWRNCVNVGAAPITRSVSGVLIGNSNRAKMELGWDRKYSFRGLISEMVENVCMAR